MSAKQPSKEIIVKIMLDEANLTFCETGERKDSPGERNLEGSAWDEGKMDGEFDQEDYQRILELQLEAVCICDEKQSTQGHYILLPEYKSLNRKERINAKKTRQSTVKFIQFLCDSL